MKWLISILLLSCAQVNTDSKLHYQQMKESHGLKEQETQYRPALKIKSSPKLIAQGKKIYQQNCQQCHGADGRGNGPEAKELGISPTDLKRAVRETEHFAFYTRYSYWDGRMPGWDREFSEQELDAITAYLYEFKK